MRAEKLIPHHIVFEAEGIGLVKRQAETAVAVIGAFDPVLGHLLRGFHIAVRFLGVSAHPEKLRHGRNAHDGLDGEVAVVRKVLEKVVRAALAFRINAVRNEIIRPLLKGLLVPNEQRGILFGNRGGGGHHQHIAAFLNRHLHFGVSAVGVGLPIQNRICADIVRRKVKRPCLALCITENRTQHCIHKLRIVIQEHGHGGIADVHRCGAAVGEAFLGNEQKPVLVVLHQLVRRHDLPVSQRQHVRILLAARLGRLLSKVGRKNLFPCGQRVMIAESLADGFLDGLSVLRPIALQALVEVFDALNIVIGKGKQRGSVIV